MYPGNRHARVRGQRYDTFIDAYVKTVAKLFPRALLQFEDFAPGNARRIQDKYRGLSRTFSDDLQGTGAVTLAAGVSAMRVCGTPLRNQRVVIFGAGTAGIGIADFIRDVMVKEGLTPEAASRRFWCVDTNGLLTDDMGDQLRDYHETYARPAAEVRGWRREGADGKKLARESADGKKLARESADGKKLAHDGAPQATNAGTISLAEVVHQVWPTTLIGTSGCRGAFTEAIIREMAWHTDRPIILPALQSFLPRRSYPGRSNRVDRWARLDCYRRELSPRSPTKG